VRKFLRPEVFNRLDAVLPFRPLAPEVVLDIARRQIDLLRQRDGFRLRPVELDIAPEVTEYLARKGYDVRYGARPLKRAIERELLAPLADAMAQYSHPVSILAEVRVAHGRICIDVRASQAVQEAPENSAQTATGQFTRAITVQRRLIARLKGCSATSELENQVTMTESLARRLAAAKWKSPEQQVRLARLPKLKECLAAIEVLHDRARHLETEVLSSFYQRETVEAALFTPELEGLKSETQRLLCEVFRLRLEEPNDIVFAIYSEHRATLLEFARAYYGLAKELGQVVSFDFFLPPPGGRSSVNRAIRQTPKKPEQPFESVPEKAIGLVMHLRGDLFFARFESEAGLHGLKDKNAAHVCLVESRRPPFLSYQPPEDVERQGGIKSKGARIRRQFNREKDEVKDSELGERPWRGVTFERCLRELIEARLNKAIASLVST